MADHAFQSDAFGRDACDRKTDEGDGRVRTCGRRRVEHTQRCPAHGCDEPCVVCEHNREQAASHHLPEAWLVDAAGASVRFCRPHETVTFTAQTARALAAALLRAADEATGG